MAHVPVVERHTMERLAKGVTRDIEAWKSYPTPKCYKESKPGKCEHTTIHIDGVEPGNRASFAIDRIDHWGPP